VFVCEFIVGFCTKKKQKKNNKERKKSKTKIWKNKKEKNNI
jgi:hypothetical protein